MELQVSDKHRMPSAGTETLLENRVSATAVPPPKDRFSFAYLFAVAVKAPLICLSTIVMGSISFCCSFFDKTGNTQHRVARAWARQLLAIGGVRVRVEGLENIEPGGSYVFISNHVSFMDTPVLMANIPVQFRFLAKQGLLQIPILGNHLHRAGHIPIPRDDIRGMLKALTHAAEIVQRRRICLVIFPEGGRTHDGLGLQELRTARPIWPWRRARRSGGLARHGANSPHGFCSRPLRARYFAHRKTRSYRRPLPQRAQGAHG